MYFIKLTTNYAGQEAQDTYINMDLVVEMSALGDGTKLRFLGDVNAKAYVVESPEEILMKLDKI